MESFYEQIDPYLNGELSGEARTHFEEALLTDPGLREELDLQRNMTEVMIARFRYEKEDAALRQTLSQVGGRYFQPDPPKESAFQKFILLLKEWFKPEPQLILRMAPVAILLVVAGWFLFHDSLYDEYRSTIQPPALVALSGGKDLLDEGNRAYQAEHWNLALEAFTKYLQENESDAYTRFYKGICEMELEHYEAAISTFNQVAATPTMQGDAYFCLALTYLKMKDKVSAKEALRKVPAESNRYGKALELLGKLSE